MRWKLATACACASALAATDAMAAEGKAALGPALEPGQKPTGPVLTGALLRRCKTLDEEIQQLDQRLEIVKSTMSVFSRELTRLNAELDVANATTDDTDADDVARYNHVVEVQNEAVARHDALVPEHNELVLRKNARVEEFNAACAGISYWNKEWEKTEVVLDPDLMPPATKF